MKHVEGLRQLIIHAYAKINLTLDILGKRADGYHDLKMVMQSVGLYDIISVKLNKNTGIYVKSSSALLADDESNTAYKAAKCFFEACGMNGCGAFIDMEKRIPMEAGMAGGSADAAAVIIALDRLCGTKLSENRLWAIGEKVGADVPFCLSGGTMLAEGKGERLTRLPELSSFADAPLILLCKPEIGVSTGRAYAAVDHCDPAVLRRPDAEAMREALAAQDVKGVAENLGNVFEQVLRIDECESIKSTMMKEGALGACMTGSGTTVFGLFDSEAAAQQACLTLGASYKNTFLTSAVAWGCKIVSES